MDNDMKVNDDMIEFWNNHMWSCSARRKGYSDYKDSVGYFVCGIQNDSDCNDHSCPFLYWLEMFSIAKIKGEI